MGIIGTLVPSDAVCSDIAGETEPDGVALALATVDGRAGEAAGATALGLAAGNDGDGLAEDVVEAPAPAPPGDEPPPLPPPSGRDGEPPPPPSRGGEPRPLPPGRDGDAPPEPADTDCRDAPGEPARPTTPEAARRAAWLFWRRFAAALPITEPILEPGMPAARSNAARPK